MIMEQIIWPRIVSFNTRLQTLMKKDVDLHELYLMK